MCQKQNNEQSSQNNDNIKDNTKNDPSSKMFDRIHQICLDAFDLDGVQKNIKKVSSVIGKDEALTLFSTIASIMYITIYNSIVCYDHQIKEELNEQFDSIITKLNNLNADIVGMQSAMKVYRKQMNEIQSKLTIENFAKSNHVDVDQN